MKEFKRILYGGDYNPNQWSKDIWEEDMRLFKIAGINSASVNIFSWAKIQPSENTYYFEELDDIMEMLTREDMDIVLATSTAALPAWMFKSYPEVARTDTYGLQHKFGQRHNACPNSPVYQKFAVNIAKKLAQRYGHFERLACWHINNEYGGECYCSNCEKAFRVWLNDKYKSIDALNKAWNMEFWGHTVYQWDEVVLPNALSEEFGKKTAFAGISIDYRRFMSDSLLENYKAEHNAIRSIDADTPITTNLMGTYKGLDYFKWAKELDIVSWDSYPAYNTPWSETAMRHDLMRGLKKKPFMLMEQTPSQQNWQPYNSLKKPGQMRTQSYQTIARGADTIQFFQLRRSVGACEKFHGAVIEHVGTGDTRVFKEVTQLGRELGALGDRLLGAKNPAEVGIIFDWDNYWALEYTSGPHIDIKYVDQIHQYYQYFYDRNIAVDMIPVDADFSGYKVIAAPVLYMVKDGMQKALEDYVKKGGVLITGMMSGIVDQSDNVHLGGYPGPLRKMAGIWVEEIDALAPELNNTLRFTDGTIFECNLLCEIIHLEGAASLAEYDSDFYKSSPAITKNKFENGFVYYVGTQPEKNALYKVLDQAASEAGISPVIPEETQLEVVCRVKDDNKYYFIMNFKDDDLPLPALFANTTDILTGNTLDANTILHKYDTVLIHKN